MCGKRHMKECSNQNMETNQISNNSRMDKVWSSHTMQYCTAMKTSNVDKSHKHNGKPETSKKECVMCDTIYTKFKHEQSYVLEVGPEPPLVRREGSTS